MRSSIHQRRTRASNLKVFVRDDVPDTIDDSDLSDSEDEGEPDSPSPTTDVFPTPPTVINPGSSQSTIDTSTVQPGGIESTATSPEPSQPTSSSPSITVSPGPLAASNEPVQAEASQVEGPKPAMSKDAAIALGTVGGAVIVATILFIIWKCYRRRNRRNRRHSGFSSGGFQKMDDSPEAGNYNVNGRTQSKIMEDLMAAAYAAEDGNVSQYGTYMDEKRQSSPDRYTTNPRRSSAPRAGANADRGSNSLYVNQIMTGFYKNTRADGVTVPPNARMPPPAAPSVAGRTEVTATTESTWRTWGWSQKKQPKETWVDKCIRLGGLK